MSRLYLTESGHVVPTLGEELTRYRRARKILDLPSTEGEATLYALVRPYEDSDAPLRISVNGTELDPIQPPEAIAYYHHLWYQVQVDPSLLTSGANTFELWTDSTAMNAWSLAIEAGHSDPGSYVSDDAGRTWRNQKMAYLNVLPGEYVMRVRLAEGEDPPPPSMVWEDPANPRLESLRRILPPGALGKGPALDRVRSISSWLASGWEHRSSSPRTAQYAPWDAETILAWGRAASGHNAQLPVVMCQHYAVAFVTSCQAVGIPARCVGLMGTPNGYDGHFVAEVWLDEYEKWAMVDANTDAIVWKDGRPLSVAEIQQEGSDLAELIEWGPGTEFQRTFPHIEAFIENNIRKGVSFRNRSIWPRADFLSHPEYSPPAQGAVSFCEVGLVWEKRNLDGGFGMFRYFADEDYFEAPPR